MPKQLLADPARWVRLPLAGPFGLRLLRPIEPLFERFKPGISTVIWFALFGAEALVLGGLLIRGQIMSTKGAAI